jgi:4-amino-4-deoxy-L-arabinose transferase-like glycosyltransferase
MKIDKALILALVIFSLLTIPFINSVPYLDGNIDFVKAHDFFVGGFGRLFGNWLSVHPPMKEIITFVFFLLGGFNQIAYNLVGILFGLFGIVVFYKLCKRLTNKSIATIAVLLFCSSPLFISAGLFSLTDYLLEIFILASLYFYSKGKFFPYFIFTSLALLTKETGLVLVISILATEGLWALKKIGPRRLLESLSPLITAAIWFLFLKINGKTPWLDWNFSGTGERGTIYTILNNLLFLKIFNKYALQNWLQLFVLNFNWVLWPIAILGITKGNINFAKSKTLLSILLFSLIYFISVLSFQTYTIPRYALPLEPFFYIAIAYGSYKISEKSNLLKLFISVFLVGITSLRLFTSLDPISSCIWGKTRILGQNIYALNQGPSLSGFDGITYNLQYNLIVKKRTEIIFDKKSKIIDCSWIFPDPNNDFKTIKILNLKNVNCYLQEENQ